MRRGGFEPPTSRLLGERSAGLSYPREDVLYPMPDSIPARAMLKEAPFCVKGLARISFLETEYSYSCGKNFFYLGLFVSRRARKPGQTILRDVPDVKYSLFLIGAILLSTETIYVI